jgi:anti-sigma regulatory factor (Ser/Thr protein kinase)
MRPRGRGILIMREFTDDLTYGRHPDGRFSVRLTKSLAAAGADAES